MADSVKEAGKLYQESLAALKEQREQIRQDLEFTDPSDPQQWDEREKYQRENDPGGARPCLVMDQCGQYIENVAGQVEQRPPALHAIPVGGGADRKAAEQMDGVFRYIEHASRASQHYVRALRSAARVGVGYLIVRPEYIDRALNYQEPRISSEGDPLRVVRDPWSVELDGSDATFGFLLTPYSPSEFARKFGDKADKVSFGDRDMQVVHDERESIIVAEQWTSEDRTTNVIVCVGADGDETSLTEDDYWLACQQAGRQLQVLRIYKDKTTRVLWSQMSGAEVLSKEVEYPASGIGIVPVYGYVGWAGGRMKYCGIGRRARAAQRAYNYHVSEIRAYMNLAPKAPWLASKRAVRGVEPLWDRASVESRAWLPFNDLDQDGPITPPQRAQVATNLQNHVQCAEQAIHDIQASLGMYQASLGAPSNESSGIAIEQRKQQGEAATAHFPSHLAAALGQVGKLCLEMLPRLVDTKRQLRIMGIDETPGSVIVDPKQPQAVAETPQGLVINPNVGRYDVRVVVGASFSTQRQQAQQAYTEMMRANPQMMPAIAPLWAQTLDVPHADKLAQVLTAMAPPAVQAILSPEKQPQTAELMAKMEQMQQALQEAIQHAQDAQKDADEAQAECDRLKADAEAKEAEVQIKAYEAETKRLQVTGANEEQIKAIVADLINQMLTSPAPLGDEQPASHEMQPFPAELPEPPNPAMGLETES